MGKAFGILLMVLALWLGLSVYTEGWPGPLRSILTPLGVETPPPDETASPALPQRVRERVKTLYQEHETRTRHAIDRD